jgi:hypothetical protein
VRKTKTGRFLIQIYSSDAKIQPEKRHHFLPISFRITAEKDVCTILVLGKTSIYGSEKNCVGVCPFYIKDLDVQRKVIVEIRKIIDSNNKSMLETLRPVVTHVVATGLFCAQKLHKNC